MTTNDGVSTDLAQFIAGLSAEDKECLVGILREPKTYLAEDMMDVLTILRQLQSENHSQEA